MRDATYHDTVKDVPDLYAWGNEPFTRAEWFALLEGAGHRPLIAHAFDGRDAVCLPLERLPDGSLGSLSNWYSFSWKPHLSAMVSEGPIDAICHGLKAKTHRVVMTKVPDTYPHHIFLKRRFRDAGWFAWSEPIDVNHILHLEGKTYEQYLQSRPGRLRTTLKRKAKKVDVSVTDRFDDADWAAYEAIYADSWKPDEGDPELLRKFAKSESDQGRYRFALAHSSGVPVAAQFWTVDNPLTLIDGDLYPTAYIHKLAHRGSAKALSPGTTLTAALMRHVIDIDRVGVVDFGTGDDSYKRDWMDGIRTRWCVTCVQPRDPRNWAILAKRLLARLAPMASRS